MADNMVVCPYCQKNFPMDEAISLPLREKWRKELAVESNRRDKELDLKQEALAAREIEVQKAKDALHAELEKRLAAQRQVLEKEAAEKAERANAIEVKDLRQQVVEAHEDLKTAQAAELQLRKERRELEAARQAFELEMTRKLDEERKAIREEAKRGLLEEGRLKELEAEKKVSDLRKQVAELTTKLEQGSEQAQGEVLELELEAILRARFPSDVFEPVPKGVNGADILQRVMEPGGRPCGTILWESKRTKNWGGGWIAKLKDDQNQAKADAAILLSFARHKEVESFGLLEGVWISDHASFIGLAAALRGQLIQVSAAKRAVVGKNEKMEVLYAYLSGPEFRQKVAAIVQTFTAMQQALDQEKRAMTKIWAGRQKQIERVITSTAGMYGDMQGIIGASLPEIKALELQSDEIGGNSTASG